MKTILSLTLALTTTCFSAGDSPSYEPIHIELLTKQVLTPSYVSHIDCKDGSFDTSYLMQLEMILEQDLGFSGRINLLKREKNKEDLATAKDPFNKTNWKTQGITHFIQAQIIDKKIEVKALNSATGSFKTFSAIPLSGTLAKDKKAIHHLSDCLVRALFEKEGICSTRILYSYQLNSETPGAKNWKAEIWECDWDGGNARQITKDGSYAVTPAAIPALKGGQEKFLYVSYKMGQPKIYLASINEGIGRKSIDIRGNQLLPAVSPTRTMIAYICDASGRSDLFIQSLNPETGELGKPEQLFSYPNASQASPTFSPDGKKIAFVSDKDGCPRIYTLNAHYHTKRQEPNLVTRVNRENTCPSWSPDGTKLAYSSKTDGIRQIWIYDFETRVEKQLTFGPGQKENPSWAPNSEHLVFNSTDHATSDLFVVNIYQPEAIKITKGPGKKHYASWTARKE
jgi:TolB protein